MDEFLEHINPQYLAREKRIGDMVRAVEANSDAVSIPINEVPVDSVMEFDSEAGKNGLAVVIAQAAIGSSDGLPLKTLNAVECPVVVIRTPQLIGEDDKKWKYSLVHVLEGEIENNMPGNKKEDLAKLTNDKSEAFFVTGTRARGAVATMRKMAYIGVATKKRISVQSENNWVNVVYKPEVNKVYVRLGKSDKVQVYDGFPENQ